MSTTPNQTETQALRDDPQRESAVLADAQDGTKRFFPFDEFLSVCFPETGVFSDGSEPLYVHGRFAQEPTDGWQAVLDGTGVLLLIHNRPNDEPDFYELPHRFDHQAEAEAWFRAQIGDPDAVLSAHAMLRAGFKPYV